MPKMVDLHLNTNSQTDSVDPFIADSSPWHALRYIHCFLFQNQIKCCFGHLDLENTFFR